MISTRNVALDFIRGKLERNFDGDLRVGGGYITPSKDADSPSIYVSTIGYVFPKQDGGERIKLKSGQMAVAFYWKDGRAAYEIFKVADLVNEILHPKPLQLELWPD